MAVDQTRMLYISLEDLAAQINAARRQLNPTKAKLVNAKQLGTQYTHLTAKKKFMVGDAEVLQWAMLRAEAEKILAGERIGKFREGELQRVAAPKRGNGKKPSTRLTGE